MYCLWKLLFSVFLYVWFLQCFFVMQSKQIFSQITLFHLWAHANYWTIIPQSAPPQYYTELISALLQTDPNYFRILRRPPPIDAYLTNMLVEFYFPPFNRREKLGKDKIKTIFIIAKIHRRLASKSNTVMQNVSVTRNEKVAKFLWIFLFWAIFRERVWFVFTFISLWV